MKKEKLIEFVLSQLVYGKKYKLPSESTEKEGRRKKEMYMEQIYPHIVMFVDNWGNRESYTYGQLYGELGGAPCSTRD